MHGAVSINGDKIVDKKQTCVPLIIAVEKMKNAVYQNLFSAKYDNIWDYDTFVLLTDIIGKRNAQ